MLHSKDASMSFGAGAGAQGKPQVGSRFERVHYKVEAFRPRFGLRSLTKLLMGAERKVPSLFYRKLWVDEFSNLVVNVGLDDSLDKHFKASAYTATWFVGLTDGTPTVAAADTMASHAGWVEVVAYSEASRPTLTLGAVSGQSVDNSASPAVFTINADATTTGGAFVVTDNTKSGGTGILYGAGAFTGGDRILATDDVLNVTVTLTAAAA